MAPYQGADARVNGRRGLPPSGPSNGVCYDRAVIWFLSDLAGNPEALLAVFAAICVALLTGIAFHEFSHAWMAYQLGDPTAANQGRLTLNPLRHLDPLGTALLFLVGFGWGKPTPVNPYRLRTGPRRGNAVVAVAGPLSNFVFALLAATPLRLGWVGMPSSLERIGEASGAEVVGLFLFYIVLLNVILGLFNLIPLHPLDGFKVAVGVLPRSAAVELERLAPWGPGILMLLIAIGWLTPFNPLGRIIGGLGSRILEVVL